MMNNKYFVPALTLIIATVTLLVLGLAIKSGKFAKPQESQGSDQQQESSKLQNAGISIPLQYFADGEFTVYTNDKLGLEVKVPNQFKVDDYSLTQYGIPVFELTPTALENANMNVNIQRYKKEVVFGTKDPQNALESEIELYKKGGLSYVGGSMTINGLSAYTMSKEQMGTRDTTVYIIKDEDVVTLKLFELKPDDKHLNLFGKILNSVRIIKQKEGVQISRSSTGGEYVWEDGNASSTYSNVQWHPIENDRFAGFSPPARLTKETTKECINDKKLKQYLKREGGLCGKGVWFEDENGSRIDSIQKLKDRFLPVNDEREAMSFVAVLEGSYFVTNEQEMIEGNTASLDDGFLVRVMQGNPFGCASHEPRSTIYKVTKNGEVNRIAREKEKSGSASSPCAD